MSECKTCAVFSEAKMRVPDTCSECGQEWRAITFCLGCGKDYPCPSDCPAGTGKVNRKVAK